MSTPAWVEFEADIRDRAYKTMDNDPQILLAGDAQFSVDAELIYARLYGMDGEIVQDGLRISAALPVLRMPITRSPWRSIETAYPPSVRTIADYRLQSARFIIALDGRHAPPGLTSLRGDDTFRLAYLRYQRRI